MKHSTIFSICLLMLFNLLTTSCAPSAESALKNEIEAAGKECPIEIPDIATITEISYEDQTVTFVFDYSPVIASVVRNTGKDILQTNIISSLMQSSDSEKLIRSIIDAEASLEFSLMEGSDLISQISFTSEDLSDLLKKYQSGELRLPTFIESSYASLESTKASLPMEISEGVFMTGCDIEINTIIYTYRIDTDEFLSIPESSMLEEKMQVTAQLKQLYSSKLSDIRKENVKFRYIYNNNQGQKLYEYTITPEDLSEK